MAGGAKPAKPLMNKAKVGRSPLLAALGLWAEAGGGPPLDLWRTQVLPVAELLGQSTSIELIRCAGVCAGVFDAVENIPDGYELFSDVDGVRLSVPAGRYLDIAWRDESGQSPTSVEARQAGASIYQADDLDHHISPAEREAGILIEAREAALDPGPG